MHTPMASKTKAAEFTSPVMWNCFEDKIIKILKNSSHAHSNRASRKKTHMDKYTQDGGIHDSRLISRSSHSYANDPTIQSFNDTSLLLPVEKTDLCKTMPASTIQNICRGERRNSSQKENCPAGLKNNQRRINKKKKGTKKRH